MGKVGEMVIAVLEMLERGYSHEKISKKLGISIQWIRDIEHNIPSIWAE
jgi:transcriptional regulator with XRE-family HTH domain